MDLALNGEENGSPFTPPSSPSRLPRRNPATVVNGQPIKSSRGPFLIGVAGGTASGKTTVCRKIMEQLEQVNSSEQRVVMISQDAFYKNLTSEEIAAANVGEYNFDHPGIVVCCHILYNLCNY